MKRLFLLCSALLLFGSLCLAAFHRQRSWLQRANADPAAVSRVNPYEGEKDAATASAKLYERYCSQCHGPNAEGIGRNPSLHSPTVKNASPGALYWLLRNGSLKRGMPSWSYLPPGQRWQIVTWMKELQ